MNADVVATAELAYERFCTGFRLSRAQECSTVLRDASASNKVCEFSSVTGSTSRSSPPTPDQRRAA